MEQLQKELAEVRRQIAKCKDYRIGDLRVLLDRKQQLEFAIGALNTCNLTENGDN